VDRNGRRPRCPLTRTSDVTWVQPYPDDPQARVERRETIELAFVTALQAIPARQAAALVLVDVLGYSTAEAAQLLGEGVTVVKGLLQRARRAMPLTRASRPPDEPGVAELVARFAEAFEADDVDTLLTLLTDEAWLAMPPAPHLYIGHGDIAEFLRASAGGRGGKLVLEPTVANRQPAFGCYFRNEAGTSPSGVVVLEVHDGGIGGITRFIDPELVGRFGPDPAPAVPN